MRPSSNGNQARWLAGVGVLIAIVALVTLAWFLRGSDERISRSTGNGERSERTDLSSTAPDIPKVDGSLHGSILSQEEKSERTRRRYLEDLFPRYDRHEDVLAIYQGYAHVNTRMVRPEKTFAIALFPEIALGYYRDIVLDKDRPWRARAVAIDSLGVLARSGHPGVKEIYLSLLEKTEDRNVARWATEFLGYYYHGDDVHSALYLRAMDGSVEAVGALAYYPNVEVDALKPQGEVSPELLASVRERVQLLKSAHSRQALAEIIQGKRELESTDEYDAKIWAAECAARGGYQELIPHLHAEVSRLVAKVMRAIPENWVHDESGRNFLLAELVRALARLGDLTEQEREYLDYNAILGDRESAARGIRSRSEKGIFRDLSRLLDSTQK